MKYLFIGLLVGLTALTPAHGQPLVVTPKLIDRMAPAQVKLLFIRCLMRTKVKEENVVEWTRYASDDPQSVIVLGSLNLNECMPVDRSGKIYGMTLKPLGLRWEVFDYLYKKKFGSQKIPRLSKIDRPDFVDEFEPSESVKLAVAIRGFADCVILRDAEAVHALLTKHRGSDAELDAFTAVVPLLSPCLVAGSDSQYSRAFIWGMLAEAMYKRAAGMVSEMPLGMVTR